MFVNMERQKVARTLNAEKRLYSLEEAAFYLGRSVWSIRELIWDDKLPPVRVGRRVHLDIRDLDSFIEAHKVKNVL